MHPIAPLPFDDREAIQHIANGYKLKSTGVFFANVVGLFDGVFVDDK